MGKVSFQDSLVHTIAGPATRTAALSMALLLGACAQSGENNFNLGLANEKPQTTNIATASAGARPEAELEKATAYWADEHNKNPRDPKAAIAFARNLKALGRKSQALAVMQTSYMHAPDDRDYLSEYGRLALEQGQVSTAGELLARADDPAKPDWRIVSARGTVLAKQGRYKDAITLYEKARTLAPDQASVVNNLAMAYTMDGQAQRGEQLLRQATSMGSTDPRVQQNLSLVMGLQGKSDTAGTATAASPATAPSNAPGQWAPQTAAKSGPALKVATATPSQAANKAKKTAWDKPLPIEQGQAASNVKTASTSAADPDQLVRAAMAAEEAKAAGAQRR